MKQRAEKTLFIGRNDELQQLLALSEKAFAGESQIIFVTGEAGIGKTYLIDEFFQRLRVDCENFVIAKGQCSIESASYLPFQSILEDLLESKKQIKITGNKVRQVMEVAIDTIWEVGPDMIGVFGIPIKAVQTLVDKLGLRGKKSFDEATIPHELNQGKIFGWYTKIMKDISVQVPLILFIDDLHWADESSLNLLLHFSREIEKQRILVIGTYRPYEITPTSLLAQIKTKLGRYGAKEISLDISENNREDIEKARQFVHEYLITKYKTNFSKNFEVLLADRTEGNALFLAEILKNMEEKGQIVKGVTNFSQKWDLSKQIEGADDLPEKIENVLQERVNRLEHSLRDILDFASVEGDEFTAQVLAKVKQIDEWNLIDDLTDKLMNIHQLITESGYSSLPGGETIDEFAFRHNLIREYVYAQLPKSKKRRIHMKIGECLERLYNGKTDKIVSKLAIHFYHAHILQKAVIYCLNAAKEVNKRYGSAEAVRFCNMGLGMLEKQKGMIDEQEYITNKILLFLELARAEEFGGNQQTTIDHIQQGILSLETTLSLLNDTLPSKLYGKVYTQLGILYRRKGNSSTFLKSQEYLEKALDYYERKEKAEQVAETLFWLGDVYNFTITNEKSIEVLERSLSIAKQLQNVELQCKCLAKLAWRNNIINYSYAKQCAIQSIQLSGENKYLKLHALYAMGLINQGTAKHKTAIHYYQKTSELARQVGDLFSETESLHQTGYNYYLYIDCQEQAKEFIRQSLTIKERLGSKRTASLSILGLISALQGDWEDAENFLREAIAEASELGQSTYRYNIARLYMFQGKYKLAEQDLVYRLSCLKKYHREVSLDELGTIILNYALLGDFKKSKQYMSMGYELLTQNTYHPRIKWSYLYLVAEAYRIIGQYDRAKIACQKSLNSFLQRAEDPNNLVYVTEAWFIMGKIFVDIKEFQEAISYLTKAALNFRICNHYALGNALFYLGKAHIGLGGTMFLAQAKDYIDEAISEFKRLKLDAQERESAELRKLCCD